MGATYDYRIYRPEPRTGEKGKGRIKTYGEVQAEVTQQFLNACEAEREYSGSGGYTGTIAEVTEGIGAWYDIGYEDKGFRNISYWKPGVGMAYKKAPISGLERAVRAAEEVAEKWGPAVAVSFMYRPDKGKRKRKGWVVLALCSE